MKTVIEMAREAGLPTSIDGMTINPLLERFAALVREDERKKQRSALQMALEVLEKLSEQKTVEQIEGDAVITALREALAQNHSGEAADMVPDYLDPPRYPKQNHSEQDLNMVQEPVAWAVAGKITNWSKDFSAYKTKTYVVPVYTTPPTAALAARQMRDSAVTLVLDDAYALTFQTFGQYRTALAKTIAALPVPEVKWREIVDDDVLEIMRNVSPATHPQLFARAVIAKFKEVNRA